MDTAWRPLKCPGCDRNLFDIDWPPGARTRLRCRHCKTRFIVEITTAGPPTRLVESVRVLTPGRARAPLLETG